MIDINKLNDDVRESIFNHEFGTDRDEETFKQDCNELFRSMTVEQAFERYCNWHGLINWSGRLIRALNNIKESHK